MQIELTEQERKFVIAALNQSIGTVEYEMVRIRQPKSFDPNKSYDSLMFYKGFRDKLGA
jgi:hypothetical protein